MKVINKMNFRGHAAKNMVLLQDRLVFLVKRGETISTMVSLAWNGETLDPNRRTYPDVYSVFEIATINDNIVMIKHIDGGGVDGKNVVFLAIENNSFQALPDYFNNKGSFLYKNCMYFLNSDSSFECVEIQKSCQGRIGLTLGSTLTSEFMSLLRNSHICKPFLEIRLRFQKLFFPFSNHFVIAVVGPDSAHIEEFAVFGEDLSLPPLKIKAEYGGGRNGISDMAIIEGEDSMLFVLGAGGGVCGYRLTTSLRGCVTFKLSKDRNITCIAVYKKYLVTGGNDGVVRVYRGGIFGDEVDSYPAPEPQVPLRPVNQSSAIGMASAMFQNFFHGGSTGHPLADHLIGKTTIPDVLSPASRRLPPITNIVVAPNGRIIVSYFDGSVKILESDILTRSVSTPIGPGIAAAAPFGGGAGASAENAR